MTYTHTWCPRQGPCWQLCEVVFNHFNCLLAALLVVPASRHTWVGTLCLVYQPGWVEQSTRWWWVRVVQVGLKLGLNCSCRVCEAAFIQLAKWGVQLEANLPRVLYLSGRAYRTSLHVQWETINRPRPAWWGYLAGPYCILYLTCSTVKALPHSLGEHLH